MYAVGLIVTGQEALGDFRIFVKTFSVWHPNAIIYVYTDSSTDVQSVPFQGTTHIRRAMDAYKGLSRSEMEKLPGKLYTSLFTDYTFEKANLLEWMFETQSEVWLLDADITFLAPLPDIPSYAKLALSPHYIRERDTRRFGFYNAGFLWMRDKEYLSKWRKAGILSRFFEQAALEDIAIFAKSKDELYEFPIQVNFGWWRMIQANNPPSRIQEQFSIFRNETSVGIRYDGKAIQSVHTHWSHCLAHQDPSFFNNWFIQYIKKFKHPPLLTLLQMIRET